MPPQFMKFLQWQWLTPTTLPLQDYRNTKSRLKPPNAKSPATLLKRPGLSPVTIAPLPPGLTMPLPFVTLPNPTLFGPMATFVNDGMFLPRPFCLLKLDRRQTLLKMHF